MNYKLIKELKAQDKMLESKTLQDWERKEVIQDYYETRINLYRELGFFKVRDSNLYFHIPIDEYLTHEYQGYRYKKRQRRELVNTNAMYLKSIIKT